MDPVVWMCVHNEPSDACDKCDSEDLELNGDRPEWQCEHQFVDLDGVCWDCREYVEGL